MGVAPLESPPAVIDTIGRHLATEAFPTTPAGYRHLLTWLRSRGLVIAVGMEGIGSFGAELSRHLQACRARFWARCTRLSITNACRRVNFWQHVLP